MANTATWMLAIIGYFFMLTLMVGTLSMGGMFKDSYVSGEMIDEYSSINSTLNSSAVIDSTARRIGTALYDIVKFSFIGLDLGLGGFGNWLVTFIFVWIPSIIMMVLLVYSIRSGSS